MARLGEAEGASVAAGICGYHVDQVAAAAAAHVGGRAAAYGYSYCGYSAHALDRQSCGWVAAGGRAAAHAGGGAGAGVPGLRCAPFPAVTRRDPP